MHGCGQRRVRRERGRGNRLRRGQCAAKRRWRRARGCLEAMAVGHRLVGAGNIAGQARQVCSASCSRLAARPADMVRGIAACWALPSTSRAPRPRDWRARQSARSRGRAGTPTAQPGRGLGRCGGDLRRPRASRPELRRRGVALERGQRLAKHDQRGLQVGHRAWRRPEPAASEASKNKPDFWNADLTSPPSSSGSSGSAAPAPADHRLLQARRQMLPDDAATPDWRTAAPGCPASVAALGRGRGDGDAAPTASACSWHGRWPAEWRPHPPAQPPRRQRDLIGRRRACPAHDCEADAAVVLRHRKLQILARLQRHFRSHVDREVGDRDPHQIGGQHFRRPGRRRRCPAAARDRARRHQPLGWRHTGRMELIGDRHRRGSLGLPER